MLNQQVKQRLVMTLNQNWRFEMIKSEIITSLSKQLTHLPEKVIADSVNHIIDHMSNTLSHGNRIEVRGFGSFSVRYHPPRNAHNPKTGEKVKADAKYTPHFKPGKELREKVDASKHLYALKLSDNDDDEDEERGAYGGSAF